MKCRRCKRQGKECESTSHEGKRQRHKAKHFNTLSPNLVLNLPFSPKRSGLRTQGQPKESMWQCASPTQLTSLDICSLVGALRASSCFLYHLLRICSCHVDCDTHGNRIIDGTIQSTTSEIHQGFDIRACGVQGFGVDLAAKVQWQPGAQAWYAYAQDPKKSSAIRGMPIHWGLSWLLIFQIQLALL